MNTIDPPVSIRKYRVADLAAYPDYQAAAAQLATILAERPNLANYTSLAGNRAALPLPFLPVIKHAQTLRMAAAYLENASVAGIRYLTTYQPVSEFLDSNEIVYTFQGISKDSIYYVAVTVILHNSLLPASSLCADLDANAQDAECLQRIIERLNGACSDDYIPSLLVIDSLVESFKFRQ